MDERTLRVGNGAAPARQARTLEHDIEQIRSRLGGLVSELDRRRQNAMDVRLQMRQHPFVVAGLGLVVAGVISLFVAKKVRQRRRARTLATRFRRLRHLLAEAIDNGPRPEVVVHHQDEPAHTGRILKAAGAAAAAQFGKQLGRRIREAF